MEEATVRVSEEASGKTEEGEGKEGLSLNIGCASSPHPCHQERHKLIRTDAFPFRIVSRFPAADAAGASHVTARSSPSPHCTFASPPNGGGVVRGGGGTPFFSTHSGFSDSYGTPSTLQPPFNFRGLGSDATLQLYSSFTAAQWQELHRQALIFKYIMTSTPVPPELLLLTPRLLPDGHSLIPNYGAVGRGGDYLNLRFTGANRDLEPDRCRRTDGKKWRCSRDVAPGQKYCERHVHRARPRSRKPVELDRRAAPATSADSAAAVSTTSVGMINDVATTTTTSTAPYSAASRSCTHSPAGLPPTGADLKFPFEFMVPHDKKLSSCRYLGSGGGDAEAQASTQRWQLGLRKATSLLQQQQQQHQHHEDDQLNLNCTSLNDPYVCPFSSTDISSLEDVAEPHDRGNAPRRFIDAWSREDHAIQGDTVCDNSKGYHNPGGGCSSSIRSLADLYPSNLTLSMSGICGSGSEDQHQFQTGLRANVDTGKMLPPSWMSPVLPVGGPLAEALQTSSAVTSILRNEFAGRGNDVTRGSAGLIDLMSKTSCDSEGTTSPLDSTRRGVSSPRRVLQKTLVSLSDSSSNASSSSTFGPGPRPELALQWSSQTN